jgi:hypothetical protein
MLDIQWHPTRKELRAFSALLIIFCAVVAGMILYRTGNSTLPAIIAAAGLAIGAIGYIWPAFARPVYVAWMIVAFPIGWLVSHLLLASIFFLVFTPIGWLLRATGHDAMKRKKNDSQSSYWETRPTPRKPADYFRQF